MSEVKENLLYSEEHEWAFVVDERTVRIGISDHAQAQLGDIVFIEFPEIGSTLSAGDSMGSIESVKTVSELYCPVSGKITKVNTGLEDAPEQVNSAPYDGGWLAELEIEGSMEEALKHLLSAEKYQELID
ncbi:glycine cleavage system protein GcvH [Paenibacillus profundus]|uniref:Glycine cleavage system H protein n=1 Tax=Paenibacillus profundus TaxID=1173085 RepID=A0ABS8YHC2_9BACL|nr:MULTISPECIES: glycine cleavage system protein GcvH [Paenibacillus]MCE5169883.1 glycine cleavage system protein GcvH [Paenibacillus profundus]MCM3342173.1 glycine cleavage system protein GcvH [Paenibacillus sp. MER TA 81-3]